MSRICQATAFLVTLLLALVKPAAADEAPSRWELADFDRESTRSGRISLFERYATLGERYRYPAGLLPHETLRVGSPRGEADASLTMLFLPIAGAVHQPYALTTACSDCHSAIHGSFADPHLRK